MCSESLGESPCGCCSAAFAKRKQCCKRRQPPGFGRRAAMRVGLDVAGNIEGNHFADSGDVQAAGSDIGRYQKVPCQTMSEAPGITASPSIHNPQ